MRLMPACSASFQNSSLDCLKKAARTVARVASPELGDFELLGCARVADASDLGELGAELARVAIRRTRVLLDKGFGRLAQYVRTHLRPERSQRVGAAPKARTLGNVRGGRV